jgi:L-ribulose-5-phosphate 3-epimerase
MKIKKLGFMQGRLSKQIGNKIQYFPWKSWEREFFEARKINLNRIEWTLDYNNLNKNPLLNLKGQKQINKLKKKYNIKCNSVTTDCFMQKPFWKLKNNARSLLFFEKIINACNKLKIRLIILPLVDNGLIQNYNDEKNLLKILNLYIPLLKKKNMQIAFESDFKPKKLKMFINKFDKKIFGINYDLGNSSHFGYDVKEEFKMYGNRILNIHIKDRKYKGSTVRLGDGNADFKSFFKMLKKINYDKNLILQVARSKIKKEFLIEIKKNILFLEKVIKSVQ